MEILEKNKQIVYEQMKELCSSHSMNWVRTVLKNLDTLPKEQEGLDLLQKLHSKLSNRYLKTDIENEIEKYPENLLKTAHVRKTTVKNCVSISEVTEYYCTFNLDIGLFCEIMKNYGAKKDHAENCFSHLLYDIRNKVQNMCGIITHYSCDERLTYKLNSEDERNLVKSCLSQISTNLDLEGLCSELAHCDKKHITKFFECYNLALELEQQNSNNKKYTKIKI